MLSLLGLAFAAFTAVLLGADHGRTYRECYDLESQLLECQTSIYEVQKNNSDSGEELYSDACKKIQTLYENRCEDFL